VIILDRLPIADRPHLITVQGDLVDVYRNQAIVWLSIGESARHFPAILDTGHSHNLSIASDQLGRWCGVTLEKIGELEIASTAVPQFRADMRLHGNFRGRTELSGKTYPLDMPQGISVFDQGSLDAPRLPLLGLRTIIANQLRLVIDGKRREITLKTSGRW
jgi:hypothetical protein